MGEYNHAIEMFKKAEKIKPGMPQSAYGLGASYRGLGRYDKAKNFLKAAISNQQGFKEAMTQLAGLDLELGHYEEANILYEKLLLDDPDSTFLRLQLAETYRQLKVIRRPLKLWRAFQMIT